MKEFTYVVERDEEGWLVASVPSLPGCYTQAKDSDALRERLKEAIELYLETVPPPAATQFVNVDRIAV